MFIIKGQSEVYYKRIELRNSQKEEMCRARYGEKVRSPMLTPGA